MNKKLVKQIELKQTTEDCPYEKILDYMESNLTVGEIYDVYLKNSKSIDDSINIYITEIEDIGDDYIIRGDADDDLSQIELKLSETQFWIS